MFKKFGLQIKSGLKFVRYPRHMFYRVLVVALLIGGVPQTAPVSAAPPDERVRREGELSVTLPRASICAGRSYDIVAKFATNEYIIGRDIQGEPTLSPFTSEPISGVVVKGWAGDESIAKINPPSAMTGWDVDIDHPGETTFVLQAKKAGQTTLNFRATWMEDTRGPVHAITVKNCDYKVSMTAFDILSIEGVTIWSSGVLNTKITGEEGQLNGTGAFNFDSGFTGPPCTISYSTFQNSTTITGQVNQNDQLVLNFQYQPGTVTSSVSCPDVPAGQGSQVVDLTLTGVNQATFPSSGGTRVFPFSVYGSTGTMMITVAPVEDGE